MCHHFHFHSKPKQLKEHSQHLLFYGDYISLDRAGCYERSACDFRLFKTPNTDWNSLSFKHRPNSGFPIESVFFHEAPPSERTPTSDIIEKARRSVSEVLLIHYYFMAGRLNFNLETKRLELVCNNAGVLFLGAKSNLRLKELVNLSTKSLSSASYPSYSGFQEPCWCSHFRNSGMFSHFHEKIKPMKLVM